MQISFLLRCEQEATYIERSNDFCFHIAFFSPLPEKGCFSFVSYFCVVFPSRCYSFSFFAFSSWGPFVLFFFSLSIWTENNWNNLTFLLPLLLLLLLLCLHTKRLWGWSYLSFIFLIEEREDELLEIGESDTMKTDF